MKNKVVPCKPDDDWEARNDLDTLRRAGEIRQDPKRLKRAETEASRQMKALENITKRGKP